MCGRFTLHANPKAIADAFGIAAPANLLTSYNIAPTQIIATVRTDDGQRQLVPMRWGLIPSWSKEILKLSLFNARADTVASKPSFRSAFKSRRCLIPGSGFYEWKVLGPKQKQPNYFRRADDAIMAFTAIWELWTGGDQPIVSCAIITTDAGDDVKAVHDRMPVILDSNTSSTQGSIRRPLSPTHRRCCFRYPPAVFTLRRSGPRLAMHATTDRS